jgi:hypothetical protein
MQNGERNMVSRVTLPILTYLTPAAGPIMHVNVFGRHLIIINSLKIANDLLEKRSNIYSNRPIFRMAGDLYYVFSYILELPLNRVLLT